MTEKNAFVPGGRSPKIMNCSVDEDIFIEMVHMERPLWDKKHRDYKNLEVKNRVWKSIAVKCKATGTKRARDERMRYFFYRFFFLVRPRRFTLLLMMCSQHIFFFFILIFPFFRIILFPCCLL